jgi:peroxiredoxin
MEAPALAKMRDELQGKGFEILGVNYGDQRSEALAFMAAYRMSFPVILDEGFTDLYRISGFPSNIVIDRHGRIRYRAEGYHPQEIARLRYIIEHLLSASS